MDTRTTDGNKTRKNRHKQTDPDVPARPNPKAKTENNRPSIMGAIEPEGKHNPYGAGASANKQR